MNSSSRQLDQKEYERRLDAVKVCGANRGPHQYIPMAWLRTESTEHVTHMMCRICFTRVNVQTLYNEFSEAKI